MGYSILVDKVIPDNMQIITTKWISRFVTNTGCWNSFIETSES